MQDNEDTVKPRQFDWLKLHLEWFDKLAPDSGISNSTQGSWELLLCGMFDRYVEDAPKLKEKEIPLSYFLQDDTE